MEDIEEKIRKLKEILGYEFDYEWSRNNPLIKKEPKFISDKDKAIINVLDSIKDYLQEEIYKSNGFYN